MPSDRPVAAKPTKSIFDPFNSSATGHQRADSRLAGSTSWRDSRNSKLRQQYISGPTGGKRVSDTVGAGSEDFGEDGRLENGGWERGAKGLRTGGQQSIWDSMNISKQSERPTKKPKLDEEEERKPTSVVNPFTPFTKADGTIRETSWTSHEDRQDFDSVSTTLKDDSLYTVEPSSEQVAAKAVPQIFSGLTIYINGSTMPYISDHRLKFLISTHGAQTTVALGRRTVTHVVVGRTNGVAGGAGGGLTASKIHKEITKVGGKGIKFVTAEWVTESIKAGQRLSESRFNGIKLSANGVASVATAFAAKSTAASKES